MSNIPEVWKSAEATPIDFIVVGAGAGGAPLAARLAERGFTVLVVEMGPAKPAPADEAVVENTDVPLLHPETTEDPRHSLRYFVKHFDHDPEGSQDPKIHRPDERSDRPHSDDEHGIFYPRAQGVGGCTLHNAMITICGRSQDWDEIAEATGDVSWRGERMRPYFERVENCHYDHPQTWWGRFKSWLGAPTGWENGFHGHSGWLDTTMADISIVKGERQFLRIVLDAVAESIASGTDHLAEWIRPVLKGQGFPGLDPNHWQTIRRSQEGITQIPCAITPDGERSGPRRRLLDVQTRYPQRLIILPEMFVTEIALSPTESEPLAGGVRATQRAIGIRVLPRPHVYEADPRAERHIEKWKEQEITIFCRNEVVLCGGAFNTPQLLMLSGIGPADHLNAQGIEVRVNSPGVGSNLQDRYEVPVIATITDRFGSLDGLGLTSYKPAAADDRQLGRWIAGPRKWRGRGVYATNGGLLGIFKRSAQEDEVPDLFIFALAGRFPGYSVGWSKPSALAPGPSRSKHPDAAADHKRMVTWLILKARTRQMGGEVRLRSKYPFRRPDINFRSFAQATEGRLANSDLESLHEGVQFVQRILKRGQDRGNIESVELPDIDRFEGDVRRWIRNTAWGHHACGTCRLGPDHDSQAVVDSRFRVRGVDRLRVVDASIFPRIPGYFIVANIYMAAEKAADVLSEDYFPRAAELPQDVAKELAKSPVYWSRAEFEERQFFPAELESAEATLVRARRLKAGV